MKRILLLLAACLLLAALAACQSSVTETCWKAAQKAGGLEDYVKEQAESIDMEALKQEAGEGGLDQQFKATALLCALEYRLDQLSEDTPDIPRFQFDYPVSAEYASRFLNQVNTEGDAFWESMKGAFSPYDCYLPILAAAKDLDGPTLVKLLDCPDGKDKFREAVDRWIEQNPGRILDTGAALTECGYFDSWDLTEWNPVFIRPGINQIRTDTAEDALRYVAYLRDVVIPPLASKYGADYYMKVSEVTGEACFSHPVMVAIKEEGPVLQEDSGSALPETIETDGKTVAAFYRNPTAGDFDDYLPALQLMGGFLLALPPEEVPASLAEADYYLVLTADFQRGDFYQTYGGSSTGIQQVISRTSVDLYDGPSGAFLRHLGTVVEAPPDSVYASYGEESLQYPTTVTPDVLTYLYHHVNEPESYVSLVDHTPVNGSVLEQDAPVIFGNWEITYHSARIVKEFETGMYIYTATDGCQFVMAELSITNRGLQSETFLPMLYYVNEDPIVRVADSSKENLYDCVDAMMYSACLNGATLDPGESKDGELLFEIPDALAQGGEPLYLAVSLGEQIVYYPLL